MIKPVSDASQLYIPVGNFGTINMGDLLQQACSHFGCLTVDQVTISPEYLKVDGCYCCNDSSDYELYLCVTVNG